MKTKVMFVLTLSATMFMLLFARGAVWTTYPRIDYPGMSTDWTLLLGSPTVQGGTNRQWALTNFFYMMRTNAQAGMQPQSDLLDQWSDIDPATKQPHTSALDLWAGHVPSEYQPLIGYTPATTNFATLSVPGLILPDGVTLVIDGTTHKLSAVTGGSGTLTGPGSITAGHIATWSTLTGLADGGHALSEYALSTITNGWPWQALNQPLTANGTAWSLLATSAKQDASANLNSWSALTTNSKQDHSANLDLWSALATSAKQDALGFTPLTPSTVTNAILGLTTPLDALVGQDTNLFGIGSSTNPVQVQIGTGLAWTKLGPGTNRLDVTVTGGTATTLPFTNIFPASSAAIIIDLAKSKDWNIGQITNNPFVISNIYSLTNIPRSAKLNFHGSTNGTFSPTTITIAGGGIMKSNNPAWFPTNASAEAVLELALDWTMTNLNSQWVTNFSPTTASTNSSTGGGGGGGGGAFALVDHQIGNASGTTPATTTLNTVGAKILFTITSFYQHNVADAGPTCGSGTFWPLNAIGDISAGVPTNQIWYNTNFTPSATTVVTCTRSFTVIPCASFSYSGTTPTLDTQSAGSATAGSNASTKQPGSATPAGANELFILGAAWTVSAVTASANSSFTLLDQQQQGANTLSGGAWYKVSSTAENPTITYSSGTLSAQNMAIFQ